MDLIPIGLSFIFPTIYQTGSVFDLPNIVRIASIVIPIMQMSINFGLFYFFIKRWEKKENRSKEEGDMVFSAFKETPVLHYLLLLVIFAVFIALKTLLSEIQTMPYFLGPYNTVIILFILGTVIGYFSSAVRDRIKISYMIKFSGELFPILDYFKGSVRCVTGLESNVKIGAIENKKYYRENRVELKLPEEEIKVHEYYCPSCNETIYLSIKSYRSYLQARLKQFNYSLLISLFTLFTTFPLIYYIFDNWERTQIQYVTIKQSKSTVSTKTKALTTSYGSKAIKRHSIR